MKLLLSLNRRQIVIFSLLALAVVQPIVSIENVDENLIESLGKQMQDEPKPPTVTKQPETVTTTQETNSQTTPKPTTSTTTTTTTTTPPPPPPSKQCLVGCNCLDKIVQCSGLKLKTMPNFKEYAKTNFITEIQIRDTSIDLVNFANLPLSSLESLEMVNNPIKQFSSPPKKVGSFSKLTKLNLNSNGLESLAGLSKWEFPSLTTLDLSGNPISQLNGIDFAKLKCNNLSSLYLNSTKLKTIDEQTFAPLVNLTSLSLKNTSLPQGYHLADSLFVKNQNLKSIDLSMNGFYEVPIALRMLPNLEVLKLSNTKLTSLRPSDFINLTGLKLLEMTNCPKLSRVDDGTFSKLFKLSEIILSDNPSLNYFSPNAFHPLAVPSKQSLENDDNNNSNNIHLVRKLDLTNNNISTLADWTQWPSVKIVNVLVENNPWDCSCDLKWLTSVQVRSELHCKTPSVYKDMEISLYFQTVDCVLIESNPQRFVLGVFLVFLLVLTIVIFVQKSDICRRLQWRDQYGTIYYTKASFPNDQV